MYNVQLEKFCKEFGLGEVLDKYLFPKGMSHRTYFVETTLGKFVIKAIVPGKTQRSLDRIEQTELIAQLINEKGVATLAAHTIKGNILNTLDGQWYLVYDFFEGKSFATKELSSLESKKVGEILAKIHQIDFSKVKLGNKQIMKYHYGKKLERKTDWQFYYDAISVKTKQPKWIEHYKLMIPLLDRMFGAAFDNFNKFIPSDEVMSHCDLFTQNILWKDGNPHIIDWEKAGIIDATYDCVFTAIRWSMEMGNEFDITINMDKLYVFLTAYLKIRGINEKRLKQALKMAWYRKMVYSEVALNRYLTPQDKVDKKRAARKFRHMLRIIRSYGELYKELPKVKKFIKSNQHPDYKSESNFRIWFKNLQNRDKI